ncbi:putative disease resistance protein At1g50180 [Carya illinoinensis]|uniref:putative disease resistance protein At1g50180 n=1 Tax=Carya illinoinensis TaxID=32201 RepID=UPI001C71A0C0|nr:putative disease resistance protein At1g50180 [Carya illinoinensis]
MDVGAVVSLVIRKLTDMLSQESIIFKEVIDEVELVRVSLRQTQNFLTDAEDRKERDYKVKKWLEEFLDLVYNAEDAIETFVLYRMHIRSMGFFSRRLTFICKKLRHGAESADLRGEVEKIKNKIEDIKNKIEEIKKRKRTSYSGNKESDPIGFKEDKKRLVARLTDTFLGRRPIISIVGQVGSGKTTLATALYDSSKINRHFDCRVWVSASENLRDILMSILQQIENSMVGEETAITELEAKIQERLRDKRYLVVLDDVRSRNALEALRALPKQTNGSRVLLTTNKEDVAWFADPSRLPYQLKPLKDDDAWNLFLKMIRLPKNVQFSELEISELKTRIIRRCKGLPLAILELGEFLSTRAASYGEWLKVLDHPVWQLDRKRDLHSEVEEIKNKINEIKEEEEHGEPLRIQEYLNVCKSSNQDEGLRQNQQSSSSYSVDEEHSDVIGFQKHKRRLVTRLTDTYLRSLHVISILGQVGSGKTTLAMELYGSNEIRYHFNFRAWVSSSENLRDVYLMLLEQADNSMDYEEVATTELVEKLREKLHNKRYLVVLDDVCSRDVLNTLRNALPNETNGSRVLLTTSNEGVARSADPRRMPYQLQPLEDDDAWNLFLKKVRLSKNIQLSAFETSELKRRIRRRCKGLPLAIVMLGGFLSTKGMSYEEWSQVLDHQSLQLDHQSLQLDRNGVEFLKILALSYNDLPFHLRPCLLYFGLFPKGYEIPVRRLLLLWLAEGFAKQSLEKTPEDVVEGYLDELIKRQMIQIKKWRKDGSPKRCLMRGELHEIISSKAEDIGFLHIQGIMSGREANESPKLSVRRVAGYGDIKEYPCKELYIQHLRSYLSFNTQNKDMPAKEIRNFLSKVVGFQGFGLLRVLDLERVYKPKLSENLEKLFHLRYLGLRWTFLDTLPDSAGRLPYLETLDVKHTYISSLPISIWKMKHIRHLCLNEICFDMSVQKPNSLLPQLQTLYGDYLWTRRVQ